MQITLSQPEAVRIFKLWHQELTDNPGQRHTENGEVRLDGVPSTRGAVHDMMGSTVRVVYKAGGPTTERAIREAREATVVMRKPRKRYDGKLIDIKKNRFGEVYFLIRTSDRRDEANDDAPAYRAMNPSKGDLLKLIINPDLDSLAEGD